MRSLLEEARNHPDKNIITRALGAERTVDVDFFDMQSGTGKYDPDVFRWSQQYGGRQKNGRNHIEF